MGKIRFMWTAIIMMVTTMTAAADEVRREDFKVPGEPGITLFVRHIAPPRTSGLPVLLVHGARVPGLASFDLPVAGGSLAADLGRAGHEIYVMDARGYGGSTRPSEMSQPPSTGPPLVRSSEIVRDIATVVEWIRGRHPNTKPLVLGWATGGHWAGYFTSLYSDRTSGLIVLNTLYGGTSAHPSLGRGSDLEDPQHPGQFTRTYGSYRLSAASSLLGVWDRSIPLDDKNQWRSPEVAHAYVAAAMASDDTSGSRTPPSFRAPSGAMEDSFYLAVGRQLWDASLIRVPTLIIRSGNDFWSRPEDATLMASHLVHAPVRMVTIANATHFVHLDRPERRRQQLISEILAFLSELQK
jgi:pimeloyl-ACP methyl ester carboxylesterase